MTIRIFRIFSIFFFILLDAPKLKGPKAVETYSYVGGQVNFTCEVLSNPPANFTWYRNSTLFTGDEEDNITINSTENKSVLSISLINNSWFEKYLCTARNERGSANVEFELKKIPKPEPPKKAKIHSTTHNSLQLEIHTPPSKYEEITGYKVQIMERQDKERGKHWEVAREVILLKGN